MEIVGKNTYEEKITQIELLRVFFFFFGERVINYVLFSV